MTPVRSSVLHSAPPDEQRSVAVGDQGWVNGEVRLPAVLAAVSGAAALKRVHGHVLPEPANGLIVAGLEAAGQRAVLRHGAQHSHD